RNAAPQEKREPRRELEVADPVWRARRNVLGLDLGTVDELGIRKDPLHDGLDAVIERAALGASGREELHHRVDVVLGRRTTERLRDERRGDLPRTLRLFVGVLRIAFEDFLSAR